MNDSLLFDRQQVELFKNWIRRRFIAEADFQEMPIEFALAWSAALKEMSEEVSHHIVPFRRRGGGQR